ncbi:MAG: hypothetical protein K2G72_04450, partial [Duncaniella sp.]|nr:hypothetical protein [Duncaniella sp.]
MHLFCYFRKEFLALFDGFVDCSDIEEGLFGIFVHLARKNHLEASDCFAQRDHHTGKTGELFGHIERLGKETLGTACARNDKLVFVRKFIDTEDSDDILKLVVLLKQLFDGLSGVVVILADDIRVKDTLSRFKRIDRRIDTKVGNLT